MRSSEFEFCRWCGGTFRRGHHYCPSPDEIDRQCRRIQSLWTDREREIRESQAAKIWQLLEIPLPTELVGAGEFVQPG